MQLRHQQRGMGLLKILFIFGMIAFVSVVGLKCFPLYSNQLKVSRVVQSVASEGSVQPGEVRKSLQRRWDIEDITLLEPADVAIERDETGKAFLSYDYDAETHLFYNATLVLNFNGREPISGNE